MLMACASQQITKMKCTKQTKFQYSSEQFQRGKSWAILLMKFDLLIILTHTKWNHLFSSPLGWLFSTSNLLFTKLSCLPSLLLHCCHNLPLRKLRHTLFHASLSGSHNATFILASAAKPSYSFKTPMISVYCNYIYDSNNMVVLNRHEKIKKDVGNSITLMKLRWMRRSMRCKRISWVYSGWPWMPIMWSPYLNISIPVLSDQATTSAFPGSSLTYIHAFTHNIIHHNYLHTNHL